MRRLHAQACSSQPAELPGAGKEFADNPWNQNPSNQAVPDFVLPSEFTLARGKGLEEKAELCPSRHLIIYASFESFQQACVSTRKQQRERHEDRL